MRKVPKLRFKEFSDEWEEKKLGEFGKISMCKRIMKDQTTLTGDIPFYKIGTFGKKADAYIDKKLFEEYKEKYSFPKKGDILLSASGTIGRTVIYDGKPAYFQDSNIVWIATNEKIILNSFLNYLYSNIKWTTENTTIARLYNDNLANMKVNIPFYQEQEKIANFLSSIDKKISLTEEKLELFREYKKGVMQKIFSQELRFKDSNGNDYPEWEEKRLGDILIKNKEKNKNNQYTLVQSISNKYGFVNQEEYFEDRKIASNNLSNYYIVKNKNFAYNPSRINVGSLAYKKDFSISVISPLYVSFYADNSYVNDIFLLNWLFSFPFYRQMNSSFEGSVRNNLNYDTLSSFNILLPILEEQEKIADFLSSIDSKIENMEKELEGLKEFKKGLLQQMFV